MGEFSWAYIDAQAVLSASGPTGSVQFRVGDHGRNSVLSGSDNFVYHTASSTLKITGSVEISGTLSANQYNINVVDKTVTNLSASGDTKFGDTSDDTHQFTGSVFVSSSLVVTGSGTETTTTINGTHVSSSLNISGSQFYGDGSELENIAKGSNTQIQFNDNNSLNGSGNLRFVSNQVRITGSLAVSGSGTETTTIIDGTHVSSSLNISGSFFYGDGSNLTNIVPVPAGANTQIQLNNSGEFGASSNLTFASNRLSVTGSLSVSGSNPATTTTIDGTHVSSSLNISGSAFYGSDVNITRQLIVSGTDVEKTTTINTTHLSSSLNISGSNFYGNDAELGGDLYIGRYIYHQGDPDTKIEFTTDKIAINAGGREFIQMQEASTDTLEINRLESSNFKFIINNSSNEMFTVDDDGIVINDGGAPDDFRVETNQKQRAFYIDGNDQFVHILVDQDHVPHRTGSDTAVFISGTIGSKGTDIRGTSVFGGDVVISGTLHGGSALDIGSDGLIVSGTTVEATTTIDGTHVSSSLNISGSAFYGSDANITRQLIVTGSAVEKTTTISTIHISSSLNISGSAFYGDGSNLTNVGAVGANTQIQFNNDGVFGASSNLSFAQNSPNPDRLSVTGSLSVSGSNPATSTTIDGTHVSSSLNISGSAFYAPDVNITRQLIVTGSNPATSTTIDGTHVSSSLNISGSAFYGDGSNLTNIPASAVGAAGADNQIQFNDDGDLEGNANLIFRGNSDLVLTGSLILTGSSQSLIVLDTRDADNLKEIVFNKDGSAAAAIQINSAEHLFVENENAKDIILRANNQNALRVIGSQRRVIIGSVTKTSATAELDVEGDAYISGSLTVSGSSTIGLGTNHQSTFGGGLTASLGISLGQNSFVATDKNILFGSQGNSAIQYNNSAAQLVISGSSGGSGGINFQGNNIQFDIANGTIKTGSLAGGKSYLGVDTNGRLVLTGSVEADVAAAGSNEQIQFNNGGSLGASAALSFDSAQSELELNGSMEIVSGSGATEKTVFEVNSGLSPGASGSVRGRMLHVKETLFDLTSGAQARTGRYVSIGPSTTVSQTLSRQNGFISPFSGRLISITYHMAAGATNQDQSKGQCGFALRVADVDSLNGNSFDSAVSELHAVTASTWPGTNRVGSINVQTGQGALNELANVTGSFSFGTGSAIGLYFRSGDSSGVNFPGQCAFTLVFELDQLDPIISGSGGYDHGGGG